MFKKIREIRAYRISKKGIGPFDYQMISNFLKGQCSFCHRDIPICSLLGNSLVVEKNKVRLLCIECRTSGKVRIDYKSIVPSDLFYGPIERDRVIIQMDKFVHNNDPNWIQILLALRTNYSYFQGSKIHTKAFEAKLAETHKDWVYKYDPIYQISDYRKPVTENYGDVLGIKSCGECGAFWGKRGTENDERREEVLRTEKCWKCKIPNKLQWHLRETFASELKKLEGVSIN